jgi:uncharacterized iron-regulated membrane protein
VFAQPLDRALHPELWEVEVGSERVSPDSALSLVLAAYPGRNAVAVNLAHEATLPYTVQLYGGLVVYLDPYRGEILGVHDLRRSLTGRIEGLHTSLLLGEVGL